MPDWKAALVQQLAALRLSPTREREVVEELSQHLDDVYRERRDAGASHDDAVREALEEIEEHELLVREMRSLRQASPPSPPVPPGAPGGNWLADIPRDVMSAARTLSHSPGWTAMVVLLLALGIGANTALFTATDALLLSPLPVADPDGLVRLRWVGRNDAALEHDEYGFNRRAAGGQPVRSAFSYPVFRQLAAEGAPGVELLAASPLASQVSVVIDGQAELADGYAATGNSFGVLGVRPRLGRVFTPEDDRSASPPVAVISWQYWRSRFGGDPSTIGKIVKVNGVPITIVGVLPPGFSGIQQVLSEPPDIVFPLELDRQVKGSSGRGESSLLDDPNAWWLLVMGRLRPGIGADGVQASLEGVFQQTARAGLDGYLRSLSDEERGSAENRDLRDIPHLLVEPGPRGVYDVDDNAKASATILSAVVGIILLIVCANVANLMLARAIARQKDIAVRLSLGATRARLVRQLLAESLVLAVAGAGLGLLVAYWGVRLLPPPASTVSVLQGRTFAFAALAAVLTSIFFGALPAFRATSVTVSTGLKQSARGVGMRRGLAGRALLVVQVALSLVLLVGAGLFLQTLGNLRRVDVGFDPQNLLLVRVAPRLGGYDLPRSQALYRTLLDRFAAIPGVRGAALSQPALLSGGVYTTNIYVGGRPAPTEARDPSGHDINRLVISPSFFQVMGIPIVRGRALTDRDDRSAPQVAVINETAARTYFPGEDPLGKRFGPAPDRANEIEVVGIAKDTRYSNLREPVPATMYSCYLQTPRAAAVFELRATASSGSVTAAVRQAVRQVDPNLPIVDVSTQVEQIERRLVSERLFAQAYTLFGAVALLLASIGLSALMSYNVSRRTGEMGVRMALGAQRPDVVRMVMKESMVLVLLGAASGLVLTAITVKLVTALLFGVAPHDAGTLLGAVAVMGIVSAAAAYLPARRASRVDPIVALRFE